MSSIFELLAKVEADDATLQDLSNFITHLEIMRDKGQVTKQTVDSMHTYVSALYYKLSDEDS